MTEPRISRMDLSAGGRRPKAGLVHLGLGAFFRAHVATYLADTMEVSGGDWGVIGVSLQNPATRDKLLDQDNLYTAVELGPQGRDPRVISIIDEVLVACENPKVVLDRLAEPAIHIVSLTVTEKGYCHEPSTGRLRWGDPAIKHDAANPEAPQTAIGYLARALDLRRRNGIRPFTVLSCDNLPENGSMTRALVLEFADAVDDRLARWVREEARFPNCMVDRIVPATTEADIEAVARETGRLDLAPVMFEPFRQWVIEDDFVDGNRPMLERAGVQLVSDVAPFEKMKLRCLNGTHSALAYLGYLAGHRTIRDVVADPVFASLCRHLWQDEIIPTLEPPQGVALSSYAQDLLERYQNPSIRHSTWQIAMDGSQKLPQRILATIGDNLKDGRPCPGLCLAVAAWMKYTSGLDENGQSIDVRDPMAQRTQALWNDNPSSVERGDAFLALEEVFGRLSVSTAFRPALIKACEDLDCFGSRGAVERLLQ